MGWLQTLAAEFAITLSNGDVWRSIGQALLFGGVCLLFGTWVARRVGLLGAGAPTGEAIGVGLASGLLVLAAWWAALASGGRSSFTPVAAGVAISIALAVARLARRPGSVGSLARAPSVIAGEARPARWPRQKSLVVAILASSCFIVAVGLLYGSTLVLSPRDGVQPLEFMDEAFYSVLGADLATTGTETIYSPSGFTELDGLPPQTWYHWGEIWLSSAVTSALGTPPLQARHLVVLPVLLLAAAALTGTLVRRVARTPSRAAYLFGFCACLFLAPLQTLAGPFFSTWALGLIFGITLYGLGAVTVLLAMYSVVVLGAREATWALAGFVGSVVAAILPAHVLLALLALVGAGSVWTLRVAHSLLLTRGLPSVVPVWRHTLVASGIMTVVTVAWGLFTGHGVGASGLSPSVTPFNDSWRDSVLITILGGGAFFAMAVAWLHVRKAATIEAGMYVGTAALLVAGALAWGARLGDFTMFHVFYSGIAVFATPVAAIAVWSTWMRLRAARHVRAAAAVLVLCIAQMEFGVAPSVVRLQVFGPHDYQPIPMDLLTAIRDLPPDAKLAYACRPFEEVAFWDSRLLALDAHTGRRIVPMCFQPEFFGSLTGTEISADVPSPLFQWAPQRALYPDSAARPTSERVASFLKDHGIDYIFVDALHPNSLVSDAIPIIGSGETQVLRIP